MDLVPYHIGIATDDIESSQRDMTAALGLTWSEPATQRVLMHDVEGRPQVMPITSSSRQGPIHIDLIKGDPDSLWDTSAPRIHHVAFRSDDVEGDVAHLEKLGWRLEITLPDPDGRPSVFAYLVNGDGLRLELVHDPTYQSYISFLEQ
jgi:catechol 2,3-dioxygenase-like lactoylglutathione lyase family enzyme